MHTKIQLLPDSVINQIAAGEVIESPTSVVKELVENALDAGAKKIGVDVVGGGLKSIVITDDGLGMAKEELPLALTRHATSKIHTADDLFALTTKGFRGEALASIAAVSKLSIISAAEGASAHRIEVEGGNVVSVQAEARTRGTTIEVRALFYNTPARKKFQKSGAALSADLLRLMTTFSLGYADVSFTLRSNGSVVLSASNGEERERQLLGDAFADGNFSVDANDGGFGLTGLISSPTLTRNNRMGQYLFINKRVVVSDLVSKAVYDGYATRLEERRHPLFVLHLTAPTHLIDVNVHPQKLHVRLQKEEWFHEKIAAAVSDAFGAKPTEMPYSFTPRSMPTLSTPRFSEKIVEAQQPLLDEQPLHVIGLFDRYFLAAEEDHLVVYDLSAAHFRLLYEELQGGSENPPPKQGLLIPMEISLSQAEKSHLFVQCERIESLGFALVQKGDLLLVEAIPQALAQSSVKDFLLDALHPSNPNRDLAYLLAQSMRKRSEFSMEEGRRLVMRLKSCNDGLHSPKGQPIKLEMSHERIEQLFTESHTASKGADNRED